MSNSQPEKRARNCSRSGPSSPRRLARNSDNGSSRTSSSTSVDGLRKAGLESFAEKGTTGTAPDLARSSAADSGAARAEEGFWVAVLPFKCSGGNADLEALAEGCPKRS